MQVETRAERIMHATLCVFVATCAVLGTLMACNYALIVLDDLGAIKVTYDLKSVP